MRELSKISIKKSKLEILLSKLKPFSKPQAKAEQHPIDSENASLVLWNAFLLGDIKDKTIADFGCGTGILGLGALLLGAKQCYFIDADKEAIKLAEENLKEVERETKMKLSDKADFINQEISSFNKKVDVIIQNPPFGTTIKHADVAFLNKALSTAKVVYSVHKTSTLEFIKQYAEKSGRVTHYFRLKLQLKKTMPWHKQKIKEIDVTCVRVETKTKS